MRVNLQWLTTYGAIEQMVVMEQTVKNCYRTIEEYYMYTKSCFQLRETIYVTLKGHKSSSLSADSKKN